MFLQIPSCTRLAIPISCTNFILLVCKAWNLKGRLSLVHHLWCRDVMALDHNWVSSGCRWCWASNSWTVWNTAARDLARCSDPWPFLRCSNLAHKMLLRSDKQVRFVKDDGSYDTFDPSEYTSRSGGKLNAILHIKARTLLLHSQNLQLRTDSKISDNGCYWWCWNSLHPACSC